MSIPVKSRIRFLQNGVEISAMIMEVGQVQLVDLSAEIYKDGSWMKSSASVAASVVTFDGEVFEEVADCPIEENVITVASEFPVGTYYLQVIANFADGDGYVGYERIQRLKLKIVLDRK